MTVCNEVPMKNTIEIALAWCKGCGICAAFCPKEVLKLDAEAEKAVVEHPEACVGCGTCERMCPDMAITVHRNGGEA